MSSDSLLSCLCVVAGKHIPGQLPETTTYQRAKGQAAVQGTTTAIIWLLCTIIIMTLQIWSHK